MSNQIEEKLYEQDYLFKQFQISSTKITKFQSKQTDCCKTKLVMSFFSVSNQIVASCKILVSAVSRGEAADGRGQTTETQSLHKL